MSNIKIAFIVLLSMSCMARAKGDLAQVERLDFELTPLGGERAGNASGTIPAWSGGVIEAPDGYKKGMHHLDPFSDDKELYRVDANNWQEHRGYLAPGHKHLLSNYPGYYLRVFPTRRSAAAPDRIYKEVRINANRAKLISHGNGIEGAVGGNPFPMPKNGLEVIWNHIARYRGEQVRVVLNQASVSSSGGYSLLKRSQDMLFNYGRKGLSQKDLNNTLFYYKYVVTSPSKLAGTAVVAHEAMDQTLSLRKIWQFNRGERRVRRIPTFAYDAVQPNTNGMVTVDMADIYNGAPDRYEWSLVGKRELIVPYNSYQVHQEGVQYSNILMQNSLNPELLRYEIHRVWVIEAALRVGFSHPYAKRRFYLDEDSWQILFVDLYDKDGVLIGAQEAHPINYYDELVFASTLESYYDFKSGRYFVDGLDNNEPMYDFHPELSVKDFSSSSLRRNGI